jgi:hypothetical protein
LRLGRPVSKRHKGAATAQEATQKGERRTVSREEQTRKTGSTTLADRDCRRETFAGRDEEVATPNPDLARRWHRIAASRFLLAGAVVTRIESTPIQPRCFKCTLSRLFFPSPFSVCRACVLGEWSPFRPSDLVAALNLSHSSGNGLATTDSGPKERRNNNTTEKQKQRKTNRHKQGEHTHTTGTHA